MPTDIFAMVRGAERRLGIANWLCPVIGLAGGMLVQEMSVLLIMGLTWVITRTRVELLRLISEVAETIQDGRTQPRMSAPV